MPRPNKRFRILCVLILILFFSVSKAQQSQVSMDANLEFSTVKPVSIVEKGQGHYFIDFGKAVFGTLSLQSKKPLKDLHIHFGEKLKGSQEIDRKPPGTIRYQEVKVSEIQGNQRFTVAFKPDNRNEKYPAIVLPAEIGRVLPFRYVEIEGLTVPIKDLKMEQNFLHYAFDDRSSSFASSDTVLNKIWDLSKHSIKATSFAGYYIDGDRERIPYEADAYINQLSHYVVDDAYGLARRTNFYFLENPTWPTEWILHTVLLFYNDYMYTGDLEPLRQHYDALKRKTLRVLAREDGLLDTHASRISPELMSSVGFKNLKQKMTDIVDWPLHERDGYELVRINTVVNAFYYRNLVLMSKIAKALGNLTDQSYFEQEAERVKAQFNATLLDKQKGYYVDGEGSTHAAIHANLFPLAFGLVPQEHAATVIEFIKSRGMACSVYAAQYLLEGLYEYGESDYALQLMNNQNGDRNWWNMIRQGSTIAWEAWDLKYKPNQDWNHAWGTAPLNIISRNMWGIQPMVPGYEEALIHPQMSTLTSSTIQVPTRHGAIRAEYSKTKEVARFDIRLPKGLDAAFRVPASSYKSLKLNGKIQEQNLKQLKLIAGKRNKIEMIL